MTDIIVTTPRSRMADAAKEAEQAKEWNVEERQYYFRNLGQHAPLHLGAGSRVYYVEDGYVRGFGTVEDDEDVVHRQVAECDTTGRKYGRGWYVYIPADSWQWIAPIPMRGFQGWRYADKCFSRDDVQVVGDWLDPKPGEKVEA